MAYQRINITLPTETLQALDQHVAKGDRSQFIHAAIQAYLSQIQKEKLRQQLKEGSIRRAQRDRHLADDWFGLEQEGWQQNAK
ncbi:MAG: ribbon-helix-helix domain-containing protein [Kovacikia sp.]